MERGGPAVAFQVTLPLNVSLTDSMIWRGDLKELLAAPLGLALAGGAEEDEPGCGEGGFEVVPVSVLVGDDDQSARCTRARALMSRACQRRDYATSVRPRALLNWLPGDQRRLAAGQQPAAGRPDQRQPD